jgi:hypothetical protein
MSGPDPQQPGPDAGSTPDVLSFPDAPPPQPVSSLNLEQVWYLTNYSASQVKIDFRSGSPVVSCNSSTGPSNGFEGTAVFTDPTTGELLFYTDGINVFNGKTNKILANGGGLYGNPSASEPALIAPKYGTQNQGFYIITNNTDNATSTSVYYSEIDLSQGPDGTVTSKNNLLMTGDPGEALDLLPNTDGTGYWIVVYDGAGSIKTYAVDRNGVSTTAVVSSTGLSGSVYRGSINHSLDYDTLALAYVSVSSGAGGTIAVAPMNRTTGTVGTATPVATGDLGFHASFSGDGTKLYYVRGTQGWSGVAYQYDLTQNKETSLGGSGLAAAKLAVDGKLYWAGWNRTYLGVVSSPNASGVSAGFDANGLSLGTCTSGYGVPNQTAAYIQYLIP